MKRAAPGGRREGEAISVHKAAAETGGRESAMEYEFLRRLYASEALTEELLAAIIESDTWNAEQRNAPRMQKAQGELSAALDALGGDADVRWQRRPFFTESAWRKPCGAAAVGARQTPAKRIAPKSLNRRGPHGTESGCNRKTVRGHYRRKAGQGRRKPQEAQKAYGG